MPENIFFKRVSAAVLSAALFFSFSISTFAAETFTYKDDALIVNSADNSEEMQERELMSGRLYIPSLDINVAIFDTTQFTTNATEESLYYAYYYFEGDDNGSCNKWAQYDIWEMGDHASDTGYNGAGPFRNLQYAIAGETKAYFQVGNRVYAFLCIKTGTAFNVGDDIVDQITGLSVIGEADYGEWNYFVSDTCMDSEGVNEYYAVWGYCGYVDL